VIYLTYASMTKSVQIPEDQRSVCPIDINLSKRRSAIVASAARTQLSRSSADSSQSGRIHACTDSLHHIHPFWTNVWTDSFPSCRLYLIRLSSVSAWAKCTGKLKLGCSPLMDYSEIDSETCMPVRKKARFDSTPFHQQHHTTSRARMKW
jgi:hypothetical protein